MSPLTTFLALLLFGLVTRYPKVAVTDAFLVTDMSDLVVYLSLSYIGLGSAVVMIALVNLLPQAVTKIESPMDALVRAVSMLIGMVAFALLKSYPLYYALTGAVMVSSFSWALISFFGFSIANPVMFIMALAKGVLVYRVMVYLGCCGAG